MLKEMKEKTDQFYPSLEKDDLEQRLQKKKNDVNSFNNYFNNIKEMITYFINKNHKSKNRFKNRTSLNTLLESVDTIVIFGATSTSITLSVTGIGLIILPISAGIACTLSLGNKILHKIIIKNYNQSKEHYQKDQQTNKIFDKLYKKTLQDNLMDKNEYQSPCNIFIKYLEEPTNESFLKKKNIKLILTFFSNFKSKFN